MRVKDISEEECRLPLAFCNHYILQFTEFRYRSVTDPDYEHPTYAFMTLKPSIDYIMVRGYNLNLRGTKAVFALRIRSLYFLNFILFLMVDKYICEFFILF